MKIIKKIGYGLLLCQLGVTPLEASDGESGFFEEGLLFPMEDVKIESYNQPSSQYQTNFFSDDGFEGWLSDDGFEGWLSDDEPGNSQLSRTEKVSYCELMGLENVDMLADFEGFTLEESKSNLVFTQVSSKLGSYSDKETNKIIQAIATWRVIYGHAFLGLPDDRIKHVLAMNGSDHIYMMSALSIPFDKKGFQFFTSLMKNIVADPKNQQPRSGSSGECAFSVDKHLLETVLTKMQGSDDELPFGLSKNKFIQSYIGVVNGEYPSSGEDMLRQYVLKHVGVSDTDDKLREKHFERFNEVYDFLSKYMIEERKLVIGDLGLYKIVGS